MAEPATSETDRLLKEILTELRSQGIAKNIRLTRAQKKDYKEKGLRYKSRSEEIRDELDFLLIRFRTAQHPKLDAITQVSEDLKLILNDSDFSEASRTALSPNDRSCTRAVLEGAHDHLRKKKESVEKFRRCAECHKITPELQCMKKWGTLCTEGMDTLKDHLDDGDLDAFLDYLYDSFFEKADEAMADVADEISSLGRKPINISLTLSRRGEFESRRNSYERQSKVTGETVVSFVSHHRVLKQYKNANGAAEKLRGLLLDTSFLPPLQTALSTTKGIYQHMRKALQDAQKHLDQISVGVSDFHQDLANQEDVAYLHHVKKWEKLGTEGKEKFKGYLENDKLDEYLEYLHDEFFKKSEEIMQTICAELSAVEMKSNNGWLTLKIEEDFEAKRNSYKSRCKKMEIELEYLDSHFRIIGHRKNALPVAKKLKEDLVDISSLQALETALPPSERTRTREALQKVQDHLSSVHKSIETFRIILTASGLRHLSEWDKLYFKGKKKITNFLKDGDLGSCIEYLHNDFFEDAEKIMSDVTFELSEMEMNSAKSWLSSEKNDKLEQWYKKYVEYVTPKVQISSVIPLSPQEDEKIKYQRTSYKSSCKRMNAHLDILMGHYKSIGVGGKFIEASQFLKEKLEDPTRAIEWNLKQSPNELARDSLKDIISNFGWLHFAAMNFQNSLYHQRHAFYFDSVGRWVKHLWEGWREMKRLIRDERLDGCLRYMLDDLFPLLKVDMNSIGEELQKFREKSLPEFLTEEKDRDTAQYANITTIATFFSSVTATTLQLSFTFSNSRSGAIVNLFWFLSLVFSVSSGVNSLLGLMWRKSSIYHTSKPPKWIRIWLEKAPIFLLIIAAVAFIFGLNFLAFLAVQPRFVSFITTGFTALLSVLLLPVLSWFFLESEQKYDIAKWILHPGQQYKKNLELQRELRWIIGDNKAVWRLTNEMSPWIEETRAKPYLLSRLVRCVLSVSTKILGEIISAPSKLWVGRKSFFSTLRAKKYWSAFRDTFSKFWAGIKETPSAIKRFLQVGFSKALETLSAFGRSFRKCWIWIRKTNARKAVDVESKGSHKIEEVHASDKVWKELVAEIGDTNLAEEVMETIKIWRHPHVQDSGDWLRRLRLLLWGHPKLAKRIEDHLIELDGISGHSDYFPKFNESSTDLKTPPVRIYYRQGPTIRGLRLDQALSDIYRT